jgi:hypothetical protein
LPLYYENDTLFNSKISGIRDLSVICSEEINAVELYIGLREALE